MTEKRKPYDSSDFDGLNPREWQFVQTFAETGSPSKAAIAAGYSERRAAATGSEKLADAKVRAAIAHALEVRGYTFDGIGGKLVELLNATAHGLTKDGLVVEMGMDGATQAKAMDMTLKVLGAYPNPKLDVNANIAATVVVRSEDQLAGDPFADVIDVTPEDA